ncbi:MAG: hypothetical protein LBH45_07215 [Campylobacteraceae bacterium]|jgi:hypothetical protein|nr:hypothetical protein [Campylobacteraceae bacterium]
MALKVTLSDLNTHLFDMIETLKEEESTKTAEDLKKEIDRANAINTIAKTIIENASLQLDAVKLFKAGDMPVTTLNSLLSLPEK